MNTQIKYRLRPFALLFCLLLPCFTAHSVEVIVHPSVKFEQLSSSHIRRIFTMHYKQWDQNLPIKVFVLAKNNLIHKAFCIQVLGVFPYQLENIWDKLLFSGMGEPPQVLESDQQIIEMVRTTPGAIGYVSSVPKNSRVRTILVGGNDD